MPANTEVTPNLGIARDWLHEDETLAAYVDRQLAQFKARMAGHTQVDGPRDRRARIHEGGTIGRRTSNGGNVRGNAIAGVNPDSPRAPVKFAAGDEFLQGRSPAQMSGQSLAGKNYGKTC